MRALVAGTLHKELVLLKSIFKRVVEWNLIDRDPTVEKTFKTFKPNQRSMFLTPEQARVC